jgi:uncharacterized surface protein with fasciclin (FAS1) repeats
VFAPIDEHLLNYLMGVETLIKPEKQETINSILTYHVLVGQNYVDRFIRWYESHNGERRRSNDSFKEGKVFINDAQVVLADVETDNGVIHAVNKVIMPA